ncbi:hypothetical protein ACEPAI_3490 [Sanghuangporus weigelae]
MISVPDAHHPLNVVSSVQFQSLFTHTSSALLQSPSILSPSNQQTLLPSITSASHQTPDVDINALVKNTNLFAKLNQPTEVEKINISDDEEQIQKDTQNVEEENTQDEEEGHSQDEEEKHSQDEEEEEEKEKEKEEEEKDLGSNDSDGSGDSSDSNGSLDQDQEQTGASLFNLQVIQHDGCFWSTPILRAMDIHVYSELRWAICKSCQVGLTSETIWGHMIKKHSQLKERVKGLGYRLKDAQSYCISLQDEHLSLEPPVTPLPFSDPIQGLAIYDAIYCPHPSCHYTSFTSKVMSKHIKSKHPKMSANVKGSKCKAQRFYTFLPLFPIQSIQHSKPMGSIFQDFHQETLQHMPTFSDAPVSTIHDRDVPPYINMTQWHLILGDWYDSMEERERIKKTLELPKLNDSLYFLRHLCLMYLIQVKG